MTNEINENEMNAYELSQMADKILRNAGLGVFGNRRSSDGYFQSRFESKMQTGAYRSNSERRKIR
jgi:hypothetical protein